LIPSGYAGRFRRIWRHLIVRGFAGQAVQARNGDERNASPAWKAYSVSEPRLLVSMGHDVARSACRQFFILSGVRFAARVELCSGSHLWTCAQAAEGMRSVGAVEESQFGTVREDCVSRGTVDGGGRELTFWIQGPFPPHSTSRSCKCFYLDVLYYDCVLELLLVFNVADDCTLATSMA